MPRGGSKRSSLRLSARLCPCSRASSARTEDKKLEVGVATINYGGANLDNLEDADAVNELREHQMELEERDEDGGQADNCKEQKVHDLQAPFSDFAEASSSDNENLLEFHYHIKTEEQLPSSKDVHVVDTPGVNSSTLYNEFEQHVPTTASNSKKAFEKRSRVSKSRLSSIPKDPKAAHGLVMKGRNRLPKLSEGPVQCKCGKHYGDYKRLLRHVKEIFLRPEDLVHCGICFRQQPSKLETFKRQSDLTRHIQFIHEGKGKRSTCPHCKKEFRPNYIKHHLKICPRKNK